ncbi:MAG: FkbM family methyltransferase, partial [Candidatus Magasanikbacteria bacterium]|nr:FkbM family methyltransferase [Candidatus Magasanikbacteria bacterium]
LHNQAVTDMVGIIDFYKITNSTACHSVVPTENAEKIATKAITLDDFIKNNNINKIDVIKIDIEGGEPRAFAGMKELFTGESTFSMVSEWNPAALESANVHPLRFLRDMENKGFEVFQILRGGKLRLFDGIQNLTFYPTGYVNFLFRKSRAKK